MKYGFQAHLSPDFPSQIIIDVTENCNLACVHCPHKNFINSRHFRGRDLDPKLNQKLVSEVRIDGKGHCKYLRYTGLGETLLHPHFIEMIKYAGKYSNVPINVTTNGIILDEEKAKSLLDAGVNVFDISIDAYSPKTYVKIRRGGNFYKTRLNVLGLISLIRKMKYNAKVVVSFVEQPLNQNEKEDFEKCWRKAGVDCVVIRPFHSAGGALEKVANSMRKNQIIDRKPCLYPWERLVLSPAGRIGFCPAEWRYQASIADFKDFTIKEIWKGEFMQKLRDAHLKNDFSHHSFCGRCPDWIMTRWPIEGRSYSDLMQEITR